jgi:hypothetical protein
MNLFIHMCNIGHLKYYFNGQSHHMKIYHKTNKKEIKSAKK